MMARKILGCAAAVSFLCLIWLSGCAGPPKEGPGIVQTVPTEQPPAPPPPEPGPKPSPPVELPEPPKQETVTLALSFAPQQSSIYKVSVERKRTVKYEGSLTDDKNLKGGQTGSQLEMIYSQQVQSVDQQGNAVVKITVDALKYWTAIRDRAEEVVIDFDSSRTADRDSPLAKLLGRSYTIAINSAGQVTNVVDASLIRASVVGATPSHQAAVELLASDTIVERHSVSALPPLDKNRLRAGEHWSNIDTFSFGMMGTKSYERVYLLKEIKQTDGRRIAVVEMNAIPTTETAKDLHKEGGADLAKIFANMEVYSGRLLLDLESGQVEKYSERLHSEWIISAQMFPGGNESGHDDAIRMIALRSHSIEKVR